MNRVLKLIQIVVCRTAIAYALQQDREHGSWTTDLQYETKVEWDNFVHMVELRPFVCHRYMSKSTCGYLKVYRQLCIPGWI